MVLYDGKHKRFPFLFLLVISTAAVCLSCTDFFSTSLARWAARDPDKLIPKVTAGNVDELIAMAENNPDLSLAVLKKIRSAANGASGKDKQKLQSAALEAAVNAAGLGQAVLNAAGELTNIKTVDDARDLVMDSLNDMKNLEDACSVLLYTLLGPDLNPDPDEFDAFTAAASTDDLAMAAALLIAGEAKKNGDPKNYVESVFDSNSPQSPAEDLAVKMIGVVIANPGELSGSLEDVLKGLGLMV